MRILSETIKSKGKPKCKSTDTNTLDESGVMDCKTLGESTGEGICCKSLGTLELTKISNTKRLGSLRQQLVMS